MNIDLGNIRGYIAALFRTCVYGHGEYYFQFGTDDSAAHCADSAASYAGLITFSRVRTSYKLFVAVLWYP